MCDYLDGLFPGSNTNGYSDGVTETGGVTLSYGGDPNALIIGAAKYAIQHNP